MRDITWGQYYSEDSVIHRLDPRVKIRFIIVYVLLLLPDRNLPQFLFLTVVLGVAIALSRVPVRCMLTGTKGVWIFVLICSAVDIFTVHGTEIWSVGSLIATREGLVKAGFVFWRMVLMILMASLLMYTTTPTRLADGMEKCMHISGSAAMGITIAMRFLPILSGKLDQILKAQTARGADFKKGGPVTRLRKLGNVILPLFQHAVTRAGHLGDAMDSRCYTGGKKRTKLHPLVYERRDILCYIVLLMVISISIVFIIAY